MKIAYVTQSFPRLSETFIISQIVALLELGHEVEIFATYNPNEEQVHRYVKDYDLLKRVHYTRQLPQNRFRRILCAALIVVGNLPRHPVKVLRSLWVFVQKYREMTLLKFIGWVIPFVDKKFDIIQCHFGPNAIRCICLKEIGISSKLVTAFHGYDVTTYIKNHSKDVYSELFRTGDLFTYNSEATKTRILSLGCPARRIAKLPMGINMGSIDFSEKRIEQNGAINVLSVGRLVEMKGREYAIKAMAGIIKKHTNVNYMIAGDGPLRDWLQKLIDDLDVSGSIHLLGWVSSEQLCDLYANSHLFLHPSVEAGNGNIEGQGVVLAEAQAYGLPVVATNHGAFPDSIVDGESGFLVPERDIDALVEKIEFLIKNPGLWPKMGRCGREFVQKNFDIKVLSKRQEHIYTALLKGANHQG